MGRKRAVTFSQGRLILLEMLRVNTRSHLLLLPVLYNAAAETPNHSLHIHPEYGNCSVCRNVGSDMSFCSAEALLLTQPAT